MKILIADDSKTDVAIISSILSDYELLYAYDGVEALEQMEQHLNIDIIILDINMPRMNGFEVLEMIKNHPEYKDIAVLVLTNVDEIDNEMRGLDLGAVDYIRKPLNIRSLRKRVELQIKLKNARDALAQQNSILEKRVQERTRESVLTRDVTIHALVSLLEVRNIESSNHTKRTQLMMRALCAHLRTKPQYSSILTEGYAAELFDTTPLHDIGKVGIPDHILLKPGKLTDDEFEIMKKHTTYGVEALRCMGPESDSLSFIRTAAEIAGTHHEKFDGTGYPGGLVGKEIPLAGRLMAIIDVYDALVNKRVYKPAFTHASATEMMQNESGTHFDPELLDAFFEIEAEVQTIADSFAQAQT
ncbi:MAG: two-component system response regulator [Clostridiales bacterium 43-6]|nr:MAG: two-component system response regulator [Clostridiales bacterium 43-6]